MKVIPLEDRLLVNQFDAAEEQMFGSLYIPDTNKERPCMGEVMAVGPGKQQEDGSFIPLQLSEGDIVLFGKYAGSTVEHDGVELLFMRQSDIMARVEDA